MAARELAAPSGNDDAARSFPALFGAFTGARHGGNAIARVGVGRRHAQKISIAMSNETRARAYCRQVGARNCRARQPRRYVPRRVSACGIRLVLRTGRAVTRGIE